LSEHAFDPVKLDLESCGYDLGSAEDYIIEPLEMKKIRTHLTFEFPEGFYGRLTPRNG
jgi:dUTP pyrophosphatase